MASASAAVAINGAPTARAFPAMDIPGCTARMMQGAKLGLFPEYIGRIRKILQAKMSSPEHEVPWAHILCVRPGKTTTRCMSRVPEDLATALVWGHDPILVSFFFFNLAGKFLLGDVIIRLELPGLTPTQLMPMLTTAYEIASHTASPVRPGTAALAA